MSRPPTSYLEFSFAARWLWRRAVPVSYTHLDVYKRQRIFGRNFDLTYSPALVVETAPDNGYRSISTVNLAFLGFGEDKLPDTWKQKLITLAAPYAPLDRCV